MEYILIGILLVVIFIIIVNKLDALEKRINSIAFNLDRVANQVGVTEHPVNEELRKLLKEGKDVEAVKKVRQVLGLSLLEGKKYIDNLK